MNIINLSKEETLEKINLRKETLEKIILTKKPLEKLVARILLCVDMSGSMEQDFRQGKVQQIIERIIPLAMKFDDDGQLEIVLFDHQAKYLNSVGLDNIYNFVNKELMPQVTFGGTDFNPFISGISNKIIYDYIENDKDNKEIVINEPIQEENVNVSFIKRIISFFTKKRSLSNLTAEENKEKSNEEVFDTSAINNKYYNYKTLVKNKENKPPMYVIVITDGETSGEYEVYEQLNKASNLPIFWQFIGIGNNSFSCLNFLNDKLKLQKNYSFLKFNDLNKISDEDLYNKLLQDFPVWIEHAKQENIL